MINDTVLEGLMATGAAKRRSNDMKDLANAIRSLVSVVANKPAPVVQVNPNIIIPEKPYPVIEIEVHRDANGDTKGMTATAKKA